jgi:glycosyltransferase involved in cell wall biosynthesis
VIKESVCLVYLGRMGAGSMLTFALAKQLTSSEVEVRLVLSSNNVELPIFRQLDIPLHLVNLPSKRLFAFIPLSNSEVNGISVFMQGTQLVYFPLPHPRDNQIIRNIGIEGLCVGRGIHDFVRHPGDLWPNRLSVILQKKYSSFLVAHSNFVGDRISSDKVSVVSLPSLSTRILYRPEKGLVIFVGRLRAYKGLKLLIHAWQTVSQKDSSFRLSISGSGRFKLREQQESITLDRRWLSELEILQLVSRANCVVFPYIEASQSGLLPILDALEIPLVVTDVGGLAEQVSNPTSLLVKTDSQEIAAAVLRTICEWQPIESNRFVCENKELAEFLILKLDKISESRTNK